MKRIVFTGGILLGLMGSLAAADPPLLEVTLRSRVSAAPNRDQFVVQLRQERWQPQQTALLICDMWDLHHSKNAAHRVGEMVPVVDRLLAVARQRGLLIIHAPSECMAAYQNHPARRRAQTAPPAADLPADLDQWCARLPSEPADRYPLDQSDGGVDDDPQALAVWHAHLRALGRTPAAPWKSQHPGLTIDPERDILSDSGTEIWNVLTQHGIRQVILLGVHTNMCVLGRPFGLRQLVKHGKKVVLLRDLTDSMYNPRRPPYVNHFQGTRLIIEYIEKYVCPTMTSDQLLGGQPFRFRDDHE